MTQQITSLLLDIFGGNPYHSVGHGGVDKVYYTTSEFPITTELIQQHLSGNITLGSYQLHADTNTVNWFGWDVDSLDLDVAKEQATRILVHLTKVPHCVEFSGGKGYHILVFLKEPMLADQAQKIVNWVRDHEKLNASGKDHVECYPKQPSLEGAEKGNLLKIPLGLHPRTRARSIFVNPDSGWENGQPVDPIETLSKKASIEELQTIVSTDTSTVSIVALDEQLAKLMAKYWEEGTRHEMALCFSGYLVNQSWDKESVESLMKKICAEAGDADVFNRIQTVSDTFKNYAAGRGVRGWQGLGKLMTFADMDRMTNLVLTIKTPDTVNTVKGLRYTNKPTDERARLIANQMWIELTDKGCKLFKTSDDGQNWRIYWYDNENHIVLDSETPRWRAMLNRRFTYNEEDKLSRMFNLELRHRIIADSPRVPIRNLTYWDSDTEKLYINRGAAEVIVIDKDGYTIQYNGTCGQFFRSNDVGSYLQPDFEADKVDVFDYLVNDLSFRTTADAPATPEEQKELLKAWFCSLFFQELHRTKPILAMLGVPGSGKTTAIRRICRVFEHLDVDVLGVPTDKQDAFRASIEHHRLLPMDNLEKSGARWMVDMLDRLSTGSHIELRQLYSSNTRYNIVPRCFVALTAVNLPFSEETLFSRLLVLDMQEIKNKRAEIDLQDSIEKFGPAIWADIIRKLCKIVKILHENKITRSIGSNRLADFVSFCQRIGSVDFLNAETLNKGILSMVNSQLRQLKESSQAVRYIDKWVTSRPVEAAKWNTVNSLFDILSTQAREDREIFQWRSWQGFELHLMTLQETLKKDYGAEFSKKKDGAMGREVTVIRFPSIGISVEEPIEVGTMIELERSR